MPSNRLPRRILYGELVNGQRLPGRPKLRYMDHIRCIVNKCNILLNWNNFQPIETRGKVPVPVAWQHTTWLQNKQQLRIDVPVGTIHPTCQLLVRDAHNAAESVLPSLACAVIIRSHVSRPHQQHS